MQRGKQWYHFPFDPTALFCFTTVIQIYKVEQVNSLVSVLHHAEMQGYRVQFQTNLITEIILSSPILMTLKEPTPKGKKRRNETSTMTSLSSTS